MNTFNDIEYGSRPHGISVEEINLTFNLDMFSDYAKVLWRNSTSKYS